MIPANFDLKSDDPFKIRNKLRDLAGKSRDGMIDLSRGDPIDSPSPAADKAFAQFLGEAAGLQWERTDDVDRIAFKLSEILGRDDFPSAEEQDALRGRGYGENVNGDDMPRAVVSHYLNTIINPGGKVKANPEDIILFAGASEAVSIIFKVLSDSGYLTDNSFVGCISPVYGPYNEQFKEYNVAKSAIPTGPKEGFRMETALDSWPPADHGSPRIVILVSPNNPTGAIYTKEELVKLASIIQDVDKSLVIEDLVYAEFSRPNSFTPFYEQLEERAIVIGSLSKAYRATGLRFGYIFIPRAAQAKISSMVGLQAGESILDSITFLKSPDSSGAFSHTHHLSRMVQYAGALRLVDMMVDSTDLDSYINNLRGRWEEFQRILGLTPQGSFAPYYVLLNFHELLSEEQRAAIGTPENLFIRLARDQGIVLLPAHRFYIHSVPNSQWHARVSAANVDAETMRDAANRIKNFITAS